MWNKQIGLVLFSACLASCSSPVHQITSTPSGARVLLKVAGRNQKPDPQELTDSGQKTPFRAEGFLDNRWYQVRMDGYKESPVIFLGHGTWQAPKKHHFNLQVLDASAALAARVALDFKVILAVFDIEDVAGLLKPAECEQLQDFLSTRLTELAGFKVIPRQQLRERLHQEQRESYRQCYDEACQIELGKEMAAGKSVSTRILKVGESCVVTAKLFDLKSATSERAASARVACTSEALLDGLDQIARQLASGTTRPAQAPSPRPLDEQ